MIAHCPAPRLLLPPLLACLPTAFLSNKPPPILSPLLSPILRQRVSLLSQSSVPSKDGWLPFLTWSSERASRLADKVSVLQIEAHPVSGELELQDDVEIQYRRLDAETLQCRIPVSEFGLACVYVWCEEDEAGDGHGWRLAELMAHEDDTDNTLPWTAEMPAAGTVTSHHTTDDDRYWAMYDATPGPTPFAPSADLRRAQSPTNEQDYYDRYNTEVQPALDADDPDHIHQDTESTLDGRVLTQAVAPRARADLGEVNSLVRAETGVRHFISTEVHSLHRLAQTVGIDGTEFERIVQTELDLLTTQIPGS